ncbi:MAG: DUF1934 domain-containing protein [Oscillospiraceae bacterium]|jgi:uncharacterized beta-barrel protein YwiB (DUF1934 family)|nr:DUF1934 domain-containing protein [Oscillospiraceae bacterium]
MDYTISILGSQKSADDDEEKFELITEGNFIHTDGATQISYQDSDVTGFKGAQTTFIVEPERITLTRDTWYGGNMVFDEREKQHFLYTTPYGSLTMGINTEFVRRDLTDCGGDVQIVYALDVDNVLVSRNSFKINVKPS